MTTRNNRHHGFISFLRLISSLLVYPQVSVPVRIAQPQQAVSTKTFRIAEPVIALPE
jgi:hypothetical protein